MTKEHLNEIMASLCKKLMIDKSDLVAIHEAALVALGIDSNAVPYGLDFLVLRGLGDAGVSKLSIDASISVFMRPRILKRMALSPLLPPEAWISRLLLPRPS